MTDTELLAALQAHAKQSCDTTTFLSGEFDLRVVAARMSALWVR